jgi:predicted porin
MKKNLLAAAVAGVLAMPGVALAQYALGGVGVNVFGTFDGGVRHQTKAIVGTGEDSLRTVTDGLRTTNRWGIRGSEDLGGGLQTNFWLEGQFDGGTGLNGTGLNFARRALVGLSGKAWHVDIGRDYTVNFKSQAVYDPMSFSYTGLTGNAGLNVAGTRSSNMVTGGFQFGTGGVRADYAMSEIIGDPFGSRMGLGAYYAFGPVTVVAALSTMDTSTTTTQDTTNLGASAVFGPFTIRAGYSNTENDTGVSATSQESPEMTLGVQWAASPQWNLRFGYYDVKYELGGTEVGDRQLMILAVDYVLSKRTTAYLAFDKNNFSGVGWNAAGAAAPINLVNTVASNDGSTGISIGIAHVF